MATTFQLGRDLRARVVHVEHLGAFPVSIWDHRRRRGAGESAGVVHAHADDERAVAARGRRLGGDGAPNRVAAFTRGSTAAMSACSAGRCRIAASVWRSPAVVAISSIPLYKMVKQEFIPTNVDEAEFDVSVNAPEGTSLAAMNEIDATRLKPRSAGYSRGSPGARRGRRRLPGRCKSGHALRAHRAARRAHFSLWRSGTSSSEVTRGRLPRPFHSAMSCRRMLRRQLAKYADLRVSVRNAPSFNIGGGQLDIDFVAARPGPRALGKYADDCEKASEDPRSRRRGHDAETDKPELRVEIDRERARPGCGHRGHRHRVCG